MLWSLLILFKLLSTYETTSHLRESREDDGKQGTEAVGCDESSETFVSNWGIFLKLYSGSPLKSH